MRPLPILFLAFLLALPFPAMADPFVCTLTISRVAGLWESKGELRGAILLQAKRDCLERAGVLIASTTTVDEGITTQDLIYSGTTANTRMQVENERYFLQGQSLAATLRVKVIVGEVQKVEKKKPHFRRTNPDGTPDISDLLASFKSDNATQEDQQDQ